MAVEHPEGKAPQQASETAKAYPKPRARDQMTESSRGTSTWQILKDLRLSIVDGGVNIIKKGLDQAAYATKPSPEPTSSEYTHESQRGTGSWQVLRDLRLSIVDGSVNMLKSQISRFTGAAKTEQAPSLQDPTAHRDVAVGPAIDKSSPADEGKIYGADPSAANKDVASQEQAAAPGGDWIDNLFDEFDAIELARQTTSPEDQRAHNVKSRDNRTSDVVEVPNEPAVVFSEDGTVIKVDYGNGTSTHVSYDANNPPGLAKITRSDGLEWRREGSGWYQYQQGKPTGETLRGTFDVQQDGTIVKKNPAGEPLEEWLPNGEKWEHAIDTAQVRKDASGNVSEKRYPPHDGAGPSTYKYKVGQLTEVQTADGKTLKRTDDGKWPLEVELQESQSGDCVIGKAEEIVAVKHRDGSETLFKWTGAKEKKKGGRIIEVVHPDGSYTRIGDDDSSVTMDANHRLVEMPLEQHSIQRSPKSKRKTGRRDTKNREERAFEMIISPNEP